MSGRAPLPPPRPVDFPLRPLLEDVAATAGIGARTSIGWHNEVAADFAVRADPDQLFRALLNLVRNASQAIEVGDGGEVRVSAEHNGEGVRIDVADNGPGLPPAARAQLFQAFASVGRAQGTGLGLMIARELVQAHAGELHVVKSDADGTTFRIQLPQG